MMNPGNQKRETENRKPILPPFLLSPFSFLLVSAALLPLAACWSHPEACFHPAAAAAPPGLRAWLENMAWHHRYTVAEMSDATGLSPGDIRRRLDEFGIRDDNRPAPPPGRLLVLPYPGGRHPRIGFLDGAVNPHRDTKAGVFLPWKDAGYVVVDVPEAIWDNGGLLYLAHTHIPTVWDQKGIKLEHIDWTVGEGGVLESRRTLPDGVSFQVRVVPGKDAVDMEMSLRNGSTRTLKNVRTQVCIMLKGAPGFEAQTKDNKVLTDHAAAVKSDDGKRWVATVWDRSKPWQNPPCPCIHSDPVFPDLKPGEEETLRGTIFFYEGEDAADEMRRREAGTKQAAGG